MALTDKLTAIGNAIRSKTNGSSLLSLTEMATAISNISTGNTTPTLHYAGWEDSNGIVSDSTNHTEYFTIDIETNMGNDFTATTPFVIMLPWQKATTGNTLGMTYANLIVFDGTTISMVAAPWNPYPDNSGFTLAAANHSITNNLSSNGTIQINIPDSTYIAGSGYGSTMKNFYYMVWGI